MLGGLDAPHGVRAVGSRPGSWSGQVLRGNDGVASGLLLGVEDLEGEEGGDYEVGDVD